MRIVILGAGAVGGYFGARLAKAGEDVFLLARGAHLAAIRERGLEIAGSGGSFRVHPPAGDRPADAGRADVLLVTVKSYDTRAAAEPCLPLMGPASFAVTLQNGLGNERVLGSILGPGRVVGGVAYVGAELAAPGRIVHDSGGRIVLGEPDGSSSPRLLDLKARFDRAGAPCEIAADLRQAVWEKFVANACFNVMAAVHGCELGDLQAGTMRQMTERAIDELVAVAAARGVTVRPAAREHCWRFCADHPRYRTSTQQDLARGRATEWEALSGALLEEARLAGLPAPTHEELCRRLRERSGAPPSVRAT